MKIGVLDAHNSEYSEVAELSLPDKQRYCATHGYDFLPFTFTKLSPANRGPTWGRVMGLQKFLPDYDLILYLDTDTIITNPSIKVETLMSKSDITIGRMADFNTGDPTHVSTSAIIIRNTEWAKDFLPYWYAQTLFIHKPYHAQPPQRHLSTFGRGGMFFEQSAFHHLYDNDPDVRAHTTIMPGTWLNEREINHRPSDFLIHFARQGNKANRMRHFLKCHKLIM